MASLSPWRVSPKNKSNPFHVKHCDVIPSSSVIVPANSTCCGGMKSSFTERWKLVNTGAISGWSSPRSRFSVHALPKEVLMDSPITGGRYSDKGGAFIVEEGISSERSDEVLEPLEPFFYYVGNKKGLRAYGIEFKEGKKGVGVYAAKDFETSKGPKVVMEVPLPLLLSVCRDPPWMFYPDIVPLEHPIFPVINSTDPETEWDFRLACLLLLAIEGKDNIFSDYSDFLPAPEDCPSLLLASAEELKELQDDELASRTAMEQKMVSKFWAKYFGITTADIRVRRLAPRVEDFLWAVSIARTRSVLLNTPMGTVNHDTHLLIPYADMLNHSWEPNCSYFWRKNDRVMEVRVNPGHTIQAGQELTFCYTPKLDNRSLMTAYGFSITDNPWEVVQFSNKAKIHRDTFLSTFDIFGIPKEYYHDPGSSTPDPFVTGSVIAAARCLPMWQNGDEPCLPSEEIRSARQLQQECEDKLMAFPTTLEEDESILEGLGDGEMGLQMAVKFRLDHKRLLRKIATSLEVYIERIII